MPGTPMPFVKPQFFTDAGAVAAGYQLFTYDAGTTTKRTTYTNSALSSTNTNPIVLDSAGRCSIYLAADLYKFVLANDTAADPPAAGDIIWTVDNVAGVPFYHLNQDIWRFGKEPTVSVSGNELTFVSPYAPTICQNYYVNNGTGSAELDIPAGTLGVGDCLILEWDVDYASADLEAEAIIFGTTVDLGSGSAYTSDTVNSTYTRARMVIYATSNTTVYYSFLVLQNTSATYEQVTMSGASIGSLNLTTTDYTVQMLMASGTYTIRGARVLYDQAIANTLTGP